MHSYEEVCIPISSITTLRNFHLLFRQNIRILFKILDIDVFIRNLHISTGKSRYYLSFLALKACLQVNQGDTEIDVQLPIPVFTCNVVLEMAEFYDTNTTGAADAPEFVHCPRCSTSVAPNPGICSNCGENVFQCVKCRAINYDEKVFSSLNQFSVSMFFVNLFNFNWKVRK